jgi:hypothetical protein
MKDSNSDRFSEQPANDSSIAPSYSHDGMEPIDAEIVEDNCSNFQGDSARKGDRVTSLVPIPNDAILDIEYLDVAERTKQFKKQPDGLWIDFFKSPWTIASMLLLLTANILICIGQWNRDSTVTAVQETSENATPPAPQPQAETSPKNTDLAAKKSDSLHLESLSLVDPGDKTAIAPNVQTAPTQTPAMANVNPQQAIAAKGTSSNLSQALLPPSLQPQQTAQPYSVPPSLAIAPPPVPSQQTQTLPVAPAPQPVSQAQPTMQTVPTLSENPDPVAELSQRQAAEQRRLEGENIPAPTLYQQNRIDGIAKQYQLDPNNVTRYYQQMQQQQAPNPNNSESANQQPTPNNVVPTSNYSESATQQPTPNNVVPTPNYSESANQQPTPNNVTITNNAPSTPNTAPVPDNGKPSVEIKNDGSVEIRSNNLR